MRIDIYSDTICPWCYVGKRRLERALRARPQVQATVHWRAFQLNPDMPREGMERQRYIELKFGGTERAGRVYEAVTLAGTEEGIAFDFAAIGRTPNTLDSHRLIRLADGKGCQDELVESLFQAYFLRGEDIGDPAVLVSAAAECGLDAEAVSHLLQSDEEAAEIRTEDLRARMSGITGVPCFIFNGRYAVPGAQAPEVLHQMFDLAQEESAAAPA